VENQQDERDLLPAISKPRIAPAKQGRPNGRLSRITTRWLDLRDAHEGMPQAMRALLERYRGAVYSYLFGAVHTPDTADELFQEFALRFLRGDFRAAKGTFLSCKPIELFKLRGG
jgi:RNA polymerase sigma-70 factor (ECF subfamily)